MQSRIDAGIDIYGRPLIAICSIDGMELNSELVRTGYVWAFVKYSEDYVSAETEAKSKKFGILLAPTQTPWDYRAERWEVAEQDSPHGCPIKDNIYSNGMIYHAPWSPWYTRTKINLEKGERWFCSEREAGHPQNWLIRERLAGSCWTTVS